jgi:dihydroorotate dehydrogenase
MYGWLRKGLFQLPPEAAHELALESMKFAGHFGLPRLVAGSAVNSPVQLMGLEFPNAVGLAAGMDKNGDYIDALGQLGFGHLELGTVTPKPQPGNPKPRSFRIKAAQAAINRMGFNNHGVDHLVERLKSHRYRGIVGANIGKQKNTPLDEAVDDYLTCLRKVHPHCDYVAVNVSSPNTADLRELQQSGRLRELLDALVAERDRLESDAGDRRPLVVKIAPDWEDAALTETLETIAEAGIDGLIATNTTTDRSAVAGLLQPGDRDRARRARRRLPDHRQRRHHESRRRRGQDPRRRRPGAALHRLHLRRAGPGPGLRARHRKGAGPCRLSTTST